MEELIYSINLNGMILQLKVNRLGYCVYIEKGMHTTIFINTSLDESMTMMQYFMNLFS